MFGSSITCEHAMTKCWTLEPTSERIVNDISSLDVTLQKIVAAKGCLVPDEDLRSGRRQAKLNGAEQCKGKTHKSQRIATLKERLTHPSAVRALDLIAQEADEEFERLDAARLQHELLAFAREDDDEEEMGQDGNGDEEEGEDPNLGLGPDSDEDTEDGGEDGEDGDEGDGEDF